MESTECRFKQSKRFVLEGKFYSIDKFNEIVSFDQRKIIFSAIELILLDSEAKSDYIEIHNEETEGVVFQGYYTEILQVIDIGEQ